MSGAEHSGPAGTAVKSGATFDTCLTTVISCTSRHFICWSIAGRT